MKFYRLMMENTEDLGRLIVSEAHHLLYLYLSHSQTLENGKPLAEAKARMNYAFRRFLMVP